MVLEIYSFYLPIIDAPPLMPRFTVTIQNYNHGQYLRQSIESVLSQSYKDYELLIVDDGSTDESLKIIEELHKEPPSFFYIANKQNRGVVAGANELIKWAQGDYLFMRASDDYLIDKDYLAKAADAFEEYPQAAGCYGACQILRKGSAHPMGDHRGGRVYYDAAYWRGKKTDGLYVPAGSVIWKTSLVREFGGFDATLGPAADALLTRLCLVHSGMVEIRTLAAALRRLPGSYSDLPTSESLKGKEEVKRRVQKYVDEQNAGGV